MTPEYSRGLTCRYFETIASILSFIRLVSSLKDKKRIFGNFFESKASGVTMEQTVKLHDLAIMMLYKSKCQLLKFLPMLFIIMPPRPLLQTTDWFMLRSVQRERCSILFCDASSLWLTYEMTIIITRHQCLGTIPVLC